MLTDAPISDENEFLRTLRDTLPIFRLEYMRIATAIRNIKILQIVMGKYVILSLIATQDWFNE